MYLLDTNILIYLLQGDEKLMSFIKTLKQKRFAISIISRFEVLIGGEKESLSVSEIESYLDEFENIDLNKIVTREAVLFGKKNQKKLKFKDLIIAATAKVHKKTLISSDKDLQSLSGIKCVYYKP